MHGSGNVHSQAILSPRKELPYVLDRRLSNSRVGQVAGTEKKNLLPHPKNPITVFPVIHPSVCVVL
jgi:hypothetical protein